MLVWLITAGEPLPLPGHTDRLHRTGLLAEALHHRGHDVVWWTSSFDHFRKRQLVPDTQTVEVDRGYSLTLLRGPGYARNVSLRRLYDHWRLAREFERLAPSQPPPDIAVCAFPTLDFAHAAVRYGRRRSIPVVVDIRDLWPDVMLDIAPAWARPVARLAAEPLDAMARFACSRATALLATTDQYLDWGLRKGHRQASDLDRAFPLGYSASVPSQAAQKRALDAWREHHITGDPAQFLVCFFGVFGPNSEIDTVIEAARILRDQDPTIKFVLCGSGDHLERYRSLAADLPNVAFPGWVDEAAIWTLMRMSATGIAPYRSIENFRRNIPNKPVEYMSAGLPVVSSLQGALATLLDKEACGVTYANRDPGALASRLRELHRDEALRRKLGDNARRVYQERFVAETVRAQMAEHLESIAHAGRPVPSRLP